jgi:hypothetical protein
MTAATNKIKEAVVRYHVLYGELPAKAVVPEKEFKLLFPDLDPSRSTGYLGISAGDDHGALRVEPGKVTDVTLFKRVG